MKINRLYLWEDVNCILDIALLQKSGMSQWVGNALVIFSKMDSWVMNMLVCFIVAGVTEVTSNTATATLLMPILSELVIFTLIY